MSEPHTLATFNADLPDDELWDDNGNLLVPGGFALAELLVAALQRLGCFCDKVVQHSFYGWSFVLDCDGKKARCILTRAEDEWLLQVERKRSRLIRFLFYSLTST